jgi:hypothetical protein
MQRARQALLDPLVVCMGAGRAAGGLEVPAGRGTSVERDAYRLHVASARVARPMSPDRHEDASACDGVPPFFSSGRLRMTRGDVEWSERGARA